MPDLREQLQELVRGRVCLVGVGSVEQGDDAVGVRLVEALAQCGVRNAECGMARIEGRDPKAEGDPKSEVRTDAALHGTTALGSRPSVGPRPSALGVDVVLAGTSPERYVGELRDGAYDAVLFLDAVEFGAAPGSVALFNAGEMLARFPQVSTHKLSLGLLAQLIEANGRTRVWLLGVQPGSLAAGSCLSPAVANTLGLLAELFRGTGMMPVDPSSDSGETPDRPEACSPHELPQTSVGRGVPTAPSAAWGQAALPFLRRSVPVQDGGFMRRVPAGWVRGEPSALRVPDSALC